MWRSVRELGVIGAVAGMVTLSATLAGSVFDHVHQVDAEALRSNDVTAVAQGEQQLVAIPDWGVQLTLPLSPGLSLMRYAAQSPMSVGLSTADLAALGEDCRAGRDGLGALLRLPAGSYATYAGRDVSMHFIAQVGGYDFAYQTPHNACSSLPGASEIINREMIMLSGAWGTLEPTGR
jgi:hypothetical protein